MQIWEAHLYLIGADNLITKLKLDGTKVGQQDLDLPSQIKSKFGLLFLKSKNNCLVKLNQNLDVVQRYEEDSQVITFDFDGSFLLVNLKTTNSILKLYNHITWKYLGNYDLGLTNVYQNQCLTDGYNIFCLTDDGKMVYMNFFQFENFKTIYKEGVQFEIIFIYEGKLLAVGGDHTLY